MWMDELDILRYRELLVTRAQFLLLQFRGDEPTRWEQMDRAREILFEADMLSGTGKLNMDDPMEFAEQIFGRNWKLRDRIRVVPLPSVLGKETITQMCHAMIEHIPDW